MNVRALVSPKFEAESVPPASAAPIADTARLAIDAVPVVSGQIPPPLTEAHHDAMGVETNETGPGERSPRASIWDCLARMLRRSARPKPDRVTQYPPRRPDFIADAAMEREMRRL